MPIATLAASPAIPSSRASGANSAGFSGALRAHRAWRAPTAAAARPAAAASDPRAFALGVERARQRLDAVLAQARQGRTFTAQELLALQADAYRFSQTLDVAARVVEHGAQSVKQAVNTQV